jgi:cobaltochelatase CobS
MLDKDSTFRGSKTEKPTMMPTKTPVKKKNSNGTGHPYRTPGQLPEGSEPPKMNGSAIAVDDTSELDEMVYIHREPATFSVRETFGLDLGPEMDEHGNVVKKNGKEVLRDKDIFGYKDPIPHTPEKIDGYVFPKDDTLAILMAMECKDPMLLVGHTGTGKTSLIEQVAARLNYGVVKVSYDGAVTRHDIIGEWVIKGKEMKFQFGVVPLAFRTRGVIVLLDEWDAQNEETAFVLQRPLQKEDRKIFVVETNKLIAMHDENIIAATANTNGQGDDTGLYSQGTRVQSYAQLNRFAVTVRLDWLKPEQEKEMLNNRFKDLDTDEVESLVTAINKVRDGFSNGAISVPLSTRDLINWADKYIKFGDAMKAARYCFLNRMNQEDSSVVQGLIQRTFEDV